MRSWHFISPNLKSFGLDDVLFCFWRLTACLCERVNYLLLHHIPNLYSSEKINVSKCTAWSRYYFLVAYDSTITHSNEQKTYYKRQIATGVGCLIWIHFFGSPGKGTVYITYNELNELNKIQNSFTLLCF